MSLCGVIIIGIKFSWNGRLRIYGKNSVGVDVKSCLGLLFTEVLNPFYVFQLASLILWALDEYYLYALCVFLVSCISIGISLYETKKVTPETLICCTLVIANVCTRL